VTLIFRIEPLSPAHDRKAFSSGVAALDRYLQELAAQDIKRRLSNCFVALDEAGVICGYYSFAASSLPLTELSPGQIKHLPHYASLPAALIGRLAVDQRFQGCRLGSALIMDAAQRAARADPAIFALVVDAKDEAAVRFYERHLFRRFISRPMSLFLPLSTALRALQSPTR
jgi:ribosomal protein S18 acetylase RimI-like enzyme